MMYNESMLIEVDGKTVNKYEGYPDCQCGRSSRWYSGTTKEIGCIPCGCTTKEFICIFCLSNTEEGSPEAIARYGVEGDRHLFYKNTDGDLIHTSKA